MLTVIAEIVLVTVNITVRRCWISLLKNRSNRTEEEVCHGYAPMVDYLRSSWRAVSVYGTGFYRDD